VQSSLCIQVLCSLILAAFLHGTRVVSVSQTAALIRGRHVYSCWALAHILVTLLMHYITWLVQYNNNNNNNRFTSLCPGLPGWAGTSRNIHPPTILIIIQYLSASSIYHDPQHPPCSYYVLDNLFAQPLSMSFFSSYSIHFFTQSVSSFTNTCPYHRDMFCCSINRAHWHQPSNMIEPY